jgi:hypothetical protein
MYMWRVLGAPAEAVKANWLTIVHCLNGQFDAIERDSDAAKLKLTFCQNLNKNHIIRLINGKMMCNCNLLLCLFPLPVTDYSYK